MKISIEGLNKAEVLIVLYEASKPQGMGFLHHSFAPLTKMESEDLLKQMPAFEYIKGRVMKVNLSGKEFDPRLYDRDNGEGAAERAIAELRNKAPTT